MKQAKRVFSFELKKILYDKTRLYFAIAIICAVLIIAFLLCFLWMGESNRGNFDTAKIWNEQVEQKYTDLMNKAYTNYLIASGQLERPSGIGAVESEEEALREYNYYKFILQIKQADFFLGYSTDHHLFSDSCNYSNYPYLSSSRLLFYQDILFISFPVLIGINVFYIFIYDKSTSFEKNYLMFRLNRTSIFYGKLLFSLFSFFFVLTLFILGGLVFYSPSSMIIYDGLNYHLTSVMSVYFERWLEMSISLLAFLLFDVAFSCLFAKSYLYIPLISLISLGLLPSFSYINESLSNNINQEYLASVSFYNMLTSNGFLDGSAAKRLLPFLVIICLCIVTISLIQLIVFSKERKRARD
jgi:hypothetical protein